MNITHSPFLFQLGILVRSSISCYTSHSFPQDRMGNWWLRFHFNHSPLLTLSTSILLTSRWMDHFRCLILQNSMKFHYFTTQTRLSTCSCLGILLISSYWMICVQNNKRHWTGKRTGWFITILFFIISIPHTTNIETPYCLLTILDNHTF